MGLKRKQVMNDSCYMSPKAPKRKPNWTETEQNCMLDLYANHKESLASRHNTPQHKAECWVSITAKLNESNTSVTRSVDEVKRKWHNLVGQGRRDFYDWKRAQQDAKSSSWTKPPKSCKALELYFNCKFEDWKSKTDDLQWDDGSRQEDCETTNSDANGAETSKHEQPPEQLPSAPSESEGSPTSLKVKEEHQGPSSVAETNLLPASALVGHLSNLSSSASKATGRIPSTSFQDPAIQQTPQVQHVWSTNAIGSTYNNSTNSVPDVKVQHDLGNIAASASLNQISLESLHQPPVTTATVHPSISATIDPSSLLTSSMEVVHASSTLHSQESPSPPPEEPARKKFRESETVQSKKREEELRMDILQLEKDKLWLETEKLRLEIDILRKQKQQMDKN